MCFSCLLRLRLCLCLAFALPFAARTVPLPCDFAAFTAETAPAFPLCFVAQTLPFPCVSAAPASTQIDDFAKEVDKVCCGSDGAGCLADQPPTTCSAACAITIHQFTAECATTLAVILEPDDPFRLNVMQVCGPCKTLM